MAKVKKTVADYPELVAQWHPIKNGKLKPKDVTAGNNKKVWWKCSIADDHEWQTQVCHRKNGKGCPCCAGRKAVPSNCLATMHPKIAAQWHPTKNKKLTPNDVTISSGKKIWWKCDIDDDHIWLTGVYCRTYRGSGCPCCAGRQAVSSNCLSTTHPEITAQWHPTKNGDLKPNDVTAGSNKRVWWKCDVDHDHVWNAKVSHRTQGRGCGCCHGIVVVSSNCLAVKRPDIASQWHPTKNGDLTPKDVTISSNKKIWWKCDVDHDHVWNARIACRTKGVGCPCCAGRKAVPSNCLAVKRPDIASQWHPTKNKKLTPNDVTISSGKKIWWKCDVDDNHVWDARVASRTGNRSGCPICNLQISHGEEIIAEILDNKKVFYKRQFSFENCKNKRKLPFDFGILKRGKIIAVLEYQGQQHYRPVQRTGVPKEVAEKNFKNQIIKDKIKVKYCRENNIPLLEIPYQWRAIPGKIEAELNIFLDGLRIRH